MSQEQIIYQQKGEVNKTVNSLTAVLTQLTLFSSSIENEKTGLSEFFTHPISQLKQVFTQLEKKIKTEFFSDQLKVQLNNLNAINFHQQAQNIISEVKKTTPEELQKEEIVRRLRALFFEDFKYFTEEYLIHKRHSRIDYPISEEGLSSESYAHINITEICQNFEKARQGANDKITRQQIETLVFGDFLTGWAQAAQVGEKMLILSPPGKRKDGYLGQGPGRYSYLFVYTKNSENNVEVEMIKVWTNMAESKELLGQIQNIYGIAQPSYIKQLKTLKKRDNLLLQPIFLKEDIETNQIEELMKPYDKNIPDAQKESKIPNEKIYWQDFKQIFDGFLSENILPLFENPDLNQERVEKIESSFSFFQRLALELVDVQKDFAKKELKYEGESRQNKLDEMLRGLETALPEFLLGKKGLLSSEQKAAYHQNLLTIFSSSGGANAFRRIASVGSCLGGTPFSLAGKILNPKLAESLTLGKLTPVQLEQFKGKDFVCPLCGIGIEKQNLCPICGKVHGIPMCNFMSDLRNKGKNLVKNVGSAIKSPPRKKAPQIKHPVQPSGKSESLGSVLADNSPSGGLGDLLATSY